MPLLDHVLVTGTTGFLGPSLIRAAPAETTLSLGLSPRGIESFSVANIEMASGVSCKPLLLNLEDPDECLEIVLALRPKAILHAAALADTGLCEREPSRSHLVNVRASMALAHAAKSLHIPFLFCSTDLVFGGDMAPYAPSDPVEPLMVYGQHKALAEQAVTSICNSALIARLPLMYGQSTIPGRGIIGDLVAALRRGESVKLFEDEYRSIAYGPSVAAGLWMALGWNRGIWHFGGPERMSRYAFGIRVAKQFGLDTRLLMPVKQADLVTGTPRPADVSLDSQASYAEGWTYEGMW